MKNYIRVGVDYFKEIDQPLLSGDTIKLLLKWSKNTIIDDFGKDSVKEIVKYESFCCFPSHTVYRREVNNFYNRYEPLSYGFTEKGDWNNIELYLKHLFGEQYELGLDYLTILWKFPTQILPILCFVSNERNTGKSTFLKFMKLIFESNMTINKNEDFRSRFNSDWANKLIIAVDEVLLDRKEDSELIKNLATSNHFKSEGKGVDKVEIEFFGKFIFCSNREDNFIKLDAAEVRYWVRKVLPFSKENPDLLAMMRSEIPFFADYLTNREILTKRTTRMWFSKEQIHTKALDVLIHGNRTSIEKELEEFLIDEFSKVEIEELFYSVPDLIEELNKRNVRVNNSYLSKILKENLNLESKNSTYKRFRVENVFCESDSFNTVFETKKGRFYTFKKELYLK